MAPWLRIVVALTLYAGVPAEGSIVISQVYGGGGNSGATYRNDFIELFNRGTNAVTVTGWSVQYASASGSTWQVTPLSGTIAPGSYYLIQEATGAGGGGALPVADATGSIPVSVSAGKIALLGQDDFQPPSRCVTRDAAAIDAASNNGEVIDRARHFPPLCRLLWRAFVFYFVSMMIET